MSHQVKLMGVLDVAEYLGVSRQYVDRLVRLGKLKYQRTSAGMIFFQSDVTAFKRKRLLQAKIDPRVRLKKTGKI
jgi:excisionase family DNA binding protein